MFSHSLINVGLEGFREPKDVIAGSETNKLIHYFKILNNLIPSYFRELMKTKGFERTSFPPRSAQKIIPFFAPCFLFTTKL